MQKKKPQSLLIPLRQMPPPMQNQQKQEQYKLLPPSLPLDEEGEQSQSKIGLKGKKIERKQFKKPKPNDWNSRRRLNGYLGEQNKEKGEKNYNDDEPLIERVKEESKDARIDIEIKAQRSVFKLKRAQTLPAMISLKTSGGSRTSVDLICVIDNSGSMSGEKIQLVKDTINFLIETLTPSDRLSIITFNSSAKRICGLKAVTPENAVQLVDYVSKIHAGGGTDINSGLELALKTIQERKFTNTVTSVFLLSDGQDKGAEYIFKETLEDPLNKELPLFTVHSFGFGIDHDEELMTNICEMKDGSFYFIKELSTLDEAFCNALGGIISIVANEVYLKLTNIAKNLVGQVKIGKTYGNMWEKVSDQVYKIKLCQLMSGITKDYVFEIVIPAIDAEVGDLNRDHDVLEGIFIGKSVNHQNMSGQAILKMTLLNENEEIPEINENVEVIENYLRVQTSEAIKENLKKADESQYQEAQKGLDKMIKTISQNKKARKQKVSCLIHDLEHIKEKCSQKDWESEGRKWTLNAMSSHSNQGNFHYSSPIQSEMLSYMMSSKIERKKL